MNSDRTIKREQSFYDQRWETFGLSALEQERVALTASAVPLQCAKVLDIGSGDGRVSEALSRRESCVVIAADLSIVALEKLSVPSVCGAAQQLPFPDSSFDLVMATEVLEHIPKPSYSRVLSELERVSSKYILITVPDDENLDETLSVCGVCSLRFHAWGHVRSYTKAVLEALFQGFRLERLGSFGGKEPRYNSMLLWVRQEVGGAWYWEQRESCYACGSSSPLESKRPFVARICDALNSRLWAPFVKRDRWLLALYTRC